MKKFLDFITGHFGFENWSDFGSSMIHKDVMPLTITFTGFLAGIGYFFEHYIGLNTVTMVAFCVLVGLELITGLLGSRAKGIKIESRKFSRFGLKFLVWISLFFVLNSLMHQYETNAIAFGIYQWLHIFIVGYVNLEYIISILENLGKITGRDYTKLINIFKKKIGGMGSQTVEDEEEVSKDETPET